MDRTFLQRFWRRLKPIKTPYLVMAFLLVGTLCAFSLRSNNLTMVKLRNEVYRADADGGDVVAALQTLRRYVGQHMNTNLAASTSGVYPPIQLKNTYERLKKAEQERVAKDNDTIYNQAQTHCEQLYPDSFSGGPRVPCVRQYIADHPIAAAKIIPDALYKFDFISPRWSPDLAGWSLVVAVLLLVLSVFRYLFGRYIAPRI